MSDEDLRAELERLRQENAALKKGGAASGVRMQVSEKGAVSIYGMGRFPVTLYKEQWLKLLENGRRYSCVHCCERSSIENEAAKQIIAKSSKVGTAPANRCNAPAWQGRQMALRRPSRMSPTHTLSG